MTAIRCFGGLAVITLTWIVRDQGLGDAHNFSDNCHLFNLLLYLVANVISELNIHEDMLFPWKGECDSDQVSWWPSSYDAYLDSERPGSDHPLRHIFFFRSLTVTYSSHCYTKSDQPDKFLRLSKSH